MYTNKKVKWEVSLIGIMKELFTDELLQMHSLRGIKRKGVTNLRFDVYTNIFAVMYEIFEYGSDKLHRYGKGDIPSKLDIEKNIDARMRHAKERIEKRMIKAEKDEAEETEREDDGYEYGDDDN